MKAKPFRKQMVESELVREASRVILYELSDPRLGFITVTRAKVSDDYSHAKIFVSVMGDEKKQKLTMAALRHAHGFIQGELMRNIRVKNFPSIIFELDESIRKSFEVTSKLDELAAERRKRGVDPSPETQEETTED